MAKHLAFTQSGIIGSRVRVVSSAVKWNVTSPNSFEITTVVGFVSR
jgi:hypothetical protein